MSSSRGRVWSGGFERSGIGQRRIGAVLAAGRDPASERVDGEAEYPAVVAEEKVGLLAGDRADTDDPIVSLRSRPLSFTVEEELTHLASVRVQPG